MASTLTVDNIVGATTSNKIHIPGHVVQIVEGSTTSEVTSTINGWADTGLSASITPTYSTSKVLVMVTQPIWATRADNEADAIVKILSNHSGSYADIVNASDSERMIQTYQSGSFSLTTAGAIYAMNKLITPSITTSFTVKTQMRFRSAYGSGGDVYAQKGGNESVIVLMEIAQ